MRVSLRIALSLTLCLPLAGCHHAVRVAAAPPPPPTAVVSVPPPTHPTEPLPVEAAAPAPSLPATPTSPPRATPPRRRPTAAPAPTVAAAAPPPAAPVDLGELTTGDADNNTFRRQTDDLVKAQTRRLSAIPAATASMHAREIDQARLFLKQATEAWNKQDIEGARTLATKAKLLLDEIPQ